MASRFSNPLAINSGQLRHVVAIQSQSTTQDEFGGEVATWNTIRATRAEIVSSTQGTRETFQAGQFAALVTHAITVRYTAYPQIQPGMRVAFQAHTYLIQTVDNVELRNVRVNLMCVEIDGAQ